MVLIRELRNIELLLNICRKMRHINIGGKGIQNTAAHMFRLDRKDCCTCVPPRPEIFLNICMTVGLLNGSKTNTRENFLFSRLFKTSKFDLDQKLCCFY